MNFHVAVRASPLILASLPGVCFSCFNKIIKKFPCSLPTLVFFYKLNSYQAISFLCLHKLFCFYFFFYSYNFYYAD